MLQERCGWSAEAAVGYGAEAWRLRANFLMLFFLVVFYPCSASIIGASNFEGFNHIFYPAAATVDCCFAAVAALAWELVLAGRTDGMTTRRALRKQKEQISACDMNQ